MISTLVRILLNDEGQGRVEYTVIIALASVAAIAALSLLGGKASNMLTNADGQLFQSITR